MDISDEPAMPPAAAQPSQIAPPIAPSTTPDVDVAMAPVDQPAVPSCPTVPPVVRVADTDGPATAADVGMEIVRDASTAADNTAPPATTNNAPAAADIASPLAPSAVAGGMAVDAEVAAKAATSTTAVAAATAESDAHSEPAGDATETVDAAAPPSNAAAAADNVSLLATSTAAGGRTDVADAAARAAALATSAAAAAAESDAHSGTAGDALKTAGAAAAQFLESLPFAPPPAPAGGSVSPELCSRRVVTASQPVKSPILLQQQIPISMIAPRSSPRVRHQRDNSITTAERSTSRARAATSKGKDRDMTRPTLASNSISRTRSPNRATSLGFILGSPKKTNDAPSMPMWSAQRPAAHAHQESFDPSSEPDRRSEDPVDTYSDIEYELMIDGSSDDYTQTRQEPTYNDEPPARITYTSTMTDAPPKVIAASSLTQRSAAKTAKPAATRPSTSRAAPVTRSRSS
ncbi:hypothetical protein GGF43_006105, partial [Coemansia sp. RSA 2618]